MKQLILASQSPRRSEILKKAQYQFVSFPVHVSEIPDKNLNLNEQIIDIARRKALECKRQLLAQGLESLQSLEAEPVILSADTMVCVGQFPNQKPIGKPENEQIALEYLSLLSGQKHEVKTAVCLIDVFSNTELIHIETTEVFFKKISDTEIKKYIATKEPMDKAGAYAIQGLGSAFVEKFVGDFDNVVGLPLPALEKLFKLNAWQFLKIQHEQQF